jgi:class 3 adenylate cyclase/predicted ATPase
MDELSSWLAGLGLERYAQVFSDNEVDLDTVRLLSEQDLERLGLPLGPRKKLLKAIAELSAGPAPGDVQANGSPTAAQALSATGAAPSATQSGQRRQLSVMFCDLVGSTELSRRLDPEEYRELLQAYRDTCARAVERYEGYVAQHLGDGVLVYFGYPVAHEDDARRAVRAALEAVSAVSDLSAGAQPLAVRVGIHTGLTVMGGGGEELALGDTPNVAARMQTLAQPGSVLVSAATRRLLGEHFRLESLGAQTLKGLGQSFEVYRVLEEAQVREGILPGSPRAALVGRDQEAGLLLDRWERAAEGDGQVVLITGEPGIGKSRMVRALDERLAGVAHHRFELRCSPYYIHTPLYPFVERLPRRLGWEAGDSVDAEIDKLVAFLSRLSIPLDESVGLLAALLSRPIPAQHALPEMSPARQRRRTLETLTALVLAMAKEQPVLLAVEDLHWADPTTLELVGRHIEQVPIARLLILLTARPGFDSPWGAHSYLTPLALNRLTRRQTGELVQKLTGGKPLPKEVADQIVGKTDGVPLFIEELTTMVLESGLLRDAGTHYELAGPLPPLAIPSTLQDSLNARLDRLAEVKDLAQLGATLGRSFRHELLRAVSPLDDAALERALGKLVEAELLFRRGTPPAATYTFKHALVQDAAYQSLLKSTRQRYHERIAKIIVEQLPGDAEQRPEYVAHHFTEAGLHDHAVQWWQRAGEFAVLRSAYPEAMAHYRRAIAVVSALPPSPQRDRLELDLQLALGFAIIPAKGYAAPEAADTYQRASELGARIDEPSKLCDALWGLAVGTWVKGDLDQAYEVASRCLALATERGDNAASIAAHHAVASTAMARGRFSEARAHFGQTFSLYGPIPRPELTPRYGQDLKANALQFLAVTLWPLGYPDQALERCRELAAYWPDSPFLYNRIWRSVGLVQTLAWFRAAEGDDAQIEADLAVCNEQGFAFMSLVITTLRGARLAQQGRVDEGIRDLKHGIAAHLSSGARFAVPVFFEFLAEAYLSIGRTEEGLAAVADGLALSGSGGEHRVDAELHRLRGELLLAGPSPHAAQAESCFLGSLEIARAQEARSFELRAATSLAHLWQRRGERKQGHELLAPIYGWFTEGFDTRDLKEAKALLDELR